MSSRSARHPTARRSGCAGCWAEVPALNELATVRAERDGDLVVAAIAGEVDPSNARGLGRELTARVPNDAMGVVLDLTEVEYLDSSGVQMVFELAERLEARQQRLAVVVP